MKHLNQLSLFNHKRHVEPNKFEAGEIRLVYSNIRPNGGKMTNSTMTANYIRDIWPDDLTIRERFYLLCLSRSNEILSYYEVSAGGVSATVVDPKLIYMAALKLPTSAIILAHNHPSGSKEPSGADIQVTQKIKEAGKLLDIMLLDHIILTEDDHFSFADEGVL